MAKAKPGQVYRKKRRGVIVTRYVGRWSAVFWHEPPHVRHLIPAEGFRPLGNHLPYIEVEEGGTVRHGSASPEALARWGTLLES